MNEIQINNQRLVDLQELESLSQLEFLGSRKVLRKTEQWEYSAVREVQKEDIGYPSVVQNAIGDDVGRYLFYAIHDPYSGIGLSIAHGEKAPFQKIANLSNVPDSRVLKVPKFPRNTSHFSSPNVIWNKDTQTWHLYFHFYRNQFAQGLGHQHTAVALSKNLLNWNILRGADGGFLSVIPTTKERWMNSQSSYHAIQRLPNGLWVAWLRGVGGEMSDGKFVADRIKLGFAASMDGIKWSIAPSSPQLVTGEAPVRGNGVIRPGFIAMLKNGLEVVWSESQQYVSATTKTFDTFSVTENAFSKIVPSDGAASVIRSKNKLHLYTGPNEYTFLIKSD